MLSLERFKEDQNRFFVHMSLGFVGRTEIVITILKEREISYGMNSILVLYVSL